MDAYPTLVDLQSRIEDAETTRRDEMGRVQLLMSILNLSADTLRHDDPSVLTPECMAQLVDWAYYGTLPMYKHAILDDVRAALPHVPEIVRLTYMRLVCIATHVRNGSTTIGPDTSLATDDDWEHWIATM